ncbi:MAG: GspH/FimT family pseudopilin [Gammaproteobacteria bacterium]
MKNGFTLMELLVTLTIIGIVAALGFPTLRYFIQNNRAMSLSTTFISDLAYARSEAVRQGKTISICASANTEQTACGTEWQNGWIIFLDPNGDGTLGSLNNRLRVHETLAPGTKISAANSRITFSSSGFLLYGVGNYQLSAEDCTGNYGRRINLAGTGRLQVINTPCP